MAFCYFNGRVADEEEVSIPIHNLGVHRGFGIFDFFRSRNGKPTFMEDYLDRFDHSQRSLYLSRRIEKQEIRDAVKELQRLNGYENCSFKLVLLGDGSDDDDVLNPFFFIINSPFDESKMLSEGKLITHEYQRENPSIKSLDYFASYQLHQRKKEAGAVDVLYHWKGSIHESSRSNIFLIKNGVLITPEEGILNGITRMHVLNVAEGMMPIERRNVTLEELLDADEIFLTSTMKEVLPITIVDNDRIGMNGPGEATAKLRETFREYISNQ